MSLFSGFYVFLEVFGNFLENQAFKWEKTIGNIYFKPSSSVIKLNLSKLMVRLWSRGSQKVKIWEFLPKNITIFSHFRASATKTKTDFGLILIDYIIRRFEISAAESFFFLDSLIFYKITKNLQKLLKAQKKGHNSRITAISVKLQTSITLSFFNTFQWNLVCRFLLLYWIFLFLYVVIKYE